MGLEDFFVDGQTGFVSLENFTAAAVAKTIDGGRTWTRMEIHDGQDNANLEGVGFVDERRGWVGGWGSSDFSKGFSSATLDGGSTWTAANQIGLFINRFRFFGTPVSVGYASGDTVYKYSAEPAPVAAFSLIVAQDAAAALLPDRRITAEGPSVAIGMRVPAGTKRLTLEVWDRFGVEVGAVLDEIRPRDGQRVFQWDGTDVRGSAVSPGDYIVRLTADDVTASSIVTLGKTPAAPPVRERPAAVRARSLVAQRPRRRTIAALMAETTPNERDLQWLKEALQIAIQLELATLPPYLTAYWTIKDEAHVARASIRVIWREEMTHFGLACNLLVAIGGSPLLTDPAVIPTYPGALPGGVRPGLTVPLRKLDRDQAKIFMEIEHPQDGPRTAGLAVVDETFDSIGEFYAAVLETFHRVDPPLTIDRQVGGFGLFKIDTMAKVEAAISKINLQGEGSKVSPEEAPGDLAHYYRFGEIFNEKRYLQNPATGEWGYDPLAPAPLPETWDMADIPEGGLSSGRCTGPRSVGSDPDVRPALFQHAWFA